MPFSRPLLTDLRKQVAADITAALPGADGLLRFSNLRIMGDAQAGLAHLHYGYLDWISRQAIPYTATEEFLEGWAALKNVLRKPATAASGQATFPGTNGAIIPVGSSVVRGDGATYTTQADATVSGGTAVVAIVADVSAAAGNADTGTVMTLASAVSGVQSGGTVTTALTGGADQETDDALRSRMLGVYQEPPQGGAENDYVQWALQVPGVTRAWCTPNGAGAGTVVVYTMFDISQAAHDGFPQGTDGVATGEPRASTATGDQLAVANHIFPLQPVTALVYSVAPIATDIDFEIDGIASASTATKDAIAAAIKDVFLLHGSPGGTVELSYIEVAIASIPGTEPFVITDPVANITVSAGHIPVLGAVSYT